MAISGAPMCVGVVLGLDVDIDVGVGVGVGVGVCVGVWVGVECYGNAHTITQVLW